MNLANTIKLQNLNAGSAGAQATVPDSRSADEWIKKWLSDKQKRSDDMRKELHQLLDFPNPVEIESAYREDKKSIFEQMPGRVAGHGRWAVVSPEGEIISRWDTKAEADAAAWPAYKGIKPSATGASGGARVKRLAAGGIGSGCRGSSCGRPKSSEFEVYHGTSVRAAKMILKYGLQPNKQTYWGGLDSHIKDRVFVSLSKERAAWYAAERAAGFKGKGRGDLAIVVVKVPRKFFKEAQDDPKDNSALMYNGRIPASLIQKVELYDRRFVGFVSKHGMKEAFDMESLYPDKVLTKKDLEAQQTDNETVFYIPVLVGQPWTEEAMDEMEAADIFQDEEHGNRTREKFLKHPKPRVVKDADILRLGDRRPSSHGQGSAGAGGTGGPSGAGI